MTPVGSIGDQAAADGALTMHQALSPFTVFGHRKAKTETLS
jgi:hypothetical protein